MKWWQSSSFKIAAVAVVVVATLAFLRFKTQPKPASHFDEIHHKSPVDGRQTLTVAFGPVTCHLSCPVTDDASRTSTTGTAFDALRFFEFPSIVDALTTK